MSAASLGSPGRGRTVSFPPCRMCLLPRIRTRSSRHAVLPATSSCPRCPVPSSRSPPTCRSLQGNCGGQSATKSLLQHAVGFAKSKGRSWPQFLNLCTGDKTQALLGLPQHCTETPPHQFGTARSRVRKAALATTWQPGPWLAVTRTWPLLCRSGPMTSSQASWPHVPEQMTSSLCLSELTW